MSNFIFHWGCDPVLFKIGGIEIRYYSLSWALCFYLSFIIFKKLVMKRNWSVQECDNALMIMIYSVALGARLGHCLFYDFEYFSLHPLEIILPLKISSSGIEFQPFSGLASHGAILGIFVGIFIFYRKYKRHPLDLLDHIAVVAPLGGGVIRFGNFFNSEILGSPTNGNYGIIFTNVDSIPRHPAQLYEAFGYFLISFIVYKCYLRFKDTTDNGFISGITLTLCFMLRFVIEFFKQSQNAYDNGILNSIGINLGQILSIPMIILGITLIIYCKKTKN